MFAFVKRKRRTRLRETPLPDAWIQAIERNVIRYNELDSVYKHELFSLIQVFASEKTFVGCAGLEINDEIRATISAYASILLLGRETDIYPDLDQILVYPEPFVVPVHFSIDDSGGLAVHEFEERDGESWQYGSVILSWASVLEATESPGDVPNVAYHEFAHQLDQENGAIDGAPLIKDADMLREWTEVFTREYQSLQAAEREGRETLIDPYGAEHPAEFFAVATETFFDLPKELRAEHPALYDLLRRFYRQDTAHDARY